MHPRKQIAVFGSFLTNDQATEMQLAQEVGYLLARSGCQVLCGGHGGIANPLVAGALRGGGEVVGLSLLETRYPGRSSKMNPLIDRTVQVHSLSERLEYFARADGFIFFTGGIGTLSEFAFVWHSLQLKADFDRPLVLLGPGWKRVLAQIRVEQMVKSKYYRLLHLCERAGDAVAVAANDYGARYDEPQERLCKEAVLFDFDGTLVVSPEEAFVRACEDRGDFFAMADVVESFHKAGRFPEAAPSARLFYLQVLENLGMTGELAGEVAGYLEERIGRQPVLYDDVAATLRRLKDKGLVTAVVSRRPEAQLKDSVATCGLSAWIDGVFSLSSAAAAKEGLEEALASAGLEKERTVHVGDSFEEDYLAPRALQLDAILLDRHLTHIAIDNAFKIRSLRELSHIVDPGGCA